MWCCLLEFAIVILSKFLINFLKLMISLTPKYKEFSNEKLDNNNAQRLASLIFTVSEGTSSTSTESRSTLRQNEIEDYIMQESAQNTNDTISP